MDDDLKKLNELYETYGKELEEYNKLEDEKRLKQTSLQILTEEYTLFLADENPDILEVVLDFKVRDKFKDELQTLWDYDKLLRPMNRRLSQLRMNITFQERLVTRNSLKLEEKNTALLIEKNKKEGK